MPLQDKFLQILIPLFKDNGEVRLLVVTTSEAFVRFEYQLQRARITLTILW